MSQFFFHPPILISISTSWWHIIGGVVLTLVFGLILFLQQRRFKNIISKRNLRSNLKERELLVQLFNNIPDRVYIKDAESRFLMANQFVTRIMGFEDPKDVIGKTDLDLFDEELGRQYYEDDRKLMEGGEPIIGKEEPGLDLEGNRIVVSTSKIPIKDKQGKLIGLVGIGRDITEQKRVEDDLRLQGKQLQEANTLLEERKEELEQMSEEMNAQADHLREMNIRLERLSLVASHTENAVVILDSNGNFEWVNQGFIHKYEMTLEEFTDQYGKNIRENSSNPNMSAILNQIYISKKPFTYNSRFLDNDGKAAWNQTNIAPIMNLDGEITNLILIDSDITEIKNAEEQIREQNQEIQKQSTELTRLNSTKDRLFSIIAHDLKNPFSSIMGFTDLLLKKHKDLDPEKMAELLGVIGESSRSALTLLENLLEWARAQTGNVKFNPDMLNLYAITDDVINLLSLQASNKNIQLVNELDTELFAFADQNMIKTVIRNLTGNAVKFTPEGGTIRFFSKRSESRIHLSISDTGVGIPEDKLQAIFSLNEIESSQGTAGESGTGLGLIVCFEFMKINNGSIDVDSTPKKGSTFTLNLPFNPI